MSCGCNQRDRYASFNGLDCEGQAERLLARVEMLIARPAVSNLFWQKFAAQVALMRSGGGPNRDPLYLLHANVYYLRDLLEAHGGAEDLAALDLLEEECF